MYFKLFAPPILDIAADRLSVTSLSPLPLPHRKFEAQMTLHNIIKTLKSVTEIILKTTKLLHVNCSN
jgi:hypothetical protein